MGIESNEKPAPAWAREIPLDVMKSLSTLPNSALRDSIDNDAEPFQDLIKKVGDYKRLFRFEDDQSAIFAQVNIAETLGDDKAMEALADHWEIKPGDYVGYGAGNGRVGFTTFGKLSETIGTLKIKNEATLSIFVAVPVTDEMKSKD